MSKENKLQSELGEGSELIEEPSLLDFINIVETNGDVLDHKIFNHDYKMASYFPTPGIEEARGPYIEEDDEDYYNFFGGNDDLISEDGISPDSLPKVNSKNNRLAKIIKLYRVIE